MTQIDPSQRRISVKKMIKNIIRPNTEEFTAHDLVNNTPYPRHSPYGVKKIASTVITVPKNEIQHFMDTIVKRYIKTLTKNSFKFFSRKKVLIETSDSDLEYLLTHSVFSRFLNPILDKVDLELFKELVNKDESYYKLDLSHLDKMKPLQGFYYCSTKTLFKNNGKSISILAIQIKDLILKPGDPDWARAKLFVIQGFCMGLLIYEHPKRHFPLDAFNGLVKTMIPKSHTIYRLLKPHLYMQLAINFAVLYINKSMALNDQNEPYTCLPCTKDGFINSLKASYEGINGNSSYTSYRYNLRPEKVPFEFGIFLEKYWWALYKFVEIFTKNIVKNDEVITHWANDVSYFVPGFPDGEEVWKKDNLTSALTTFIYTVSFAHSADHHDFARTKINQVPIRLRIKPPSSKNRFQVWPEKIFFTRSDLHRHYLSMEMFIKPTNLTTILDIEYETYNELEEFAVKNFRKEAQLIEDNLKTKNYIPLKEVAASIQY